MLDPDLGVLGNNGGPTLTHQPNPKGTKAVIDKGFCVSEPHDQRLLGNASTGKRGVDLDDVANGAGSDGCDIGAVESGAEEIPEDETVCFTIASQNGIRGVFCL